MNQKRLISEAEFERIYGVPAGTLRQWRFRGKGPAYKKLAGSVRYDIQDIEAWLKQCSRTSTHGATV